jgi:hypothetical protein
VSVGQWSRALFASRASSWHCRHCGTGESIALTGAISHESSGSESPRLCEWPQIIPSFEIRAGLALNASENALQLCSYRYSHCSDCVINVRNCEKRKFEHLLRW